MQLSRPRPRRNTDRWPPVQPAAKDPSVAAIGGRVGRRSIETIASRLHPQWREYFLAQEFEHGPARRLLNDRRGKHVICVAVLPTRARIEVERLRGPSVQDSARLKA